MQLLISIRVCTCIPTLPLLPLLFLLLPSATLLLPLPVFLHPTKSPSSSPCLIAASSLPPPCHSQLLPCHHFLSLSSYALWYPSFSSLFFVLVAILFTYVLFCWSMSVEMTDLEFICLFVFCLSCIACKHTFLWFSFSLVLTSKSLPLICIWLHCVDFLICTLGQCSRLGIFWFAHPKAWISFTY